MSRASRPRENRLFAQLLRLSLLLASLTLLLLTADPGRSQSPNRPRISIAPTLTAEAMTEIPFPIRVAATPAVPRDSVVRVRGLPQMAALSDGYSTAPGSWVVPLKALAGLKLMLPATAATTAEVVITLVAFDGAPLDEAKTTLVINPKLPAKADAPSGAETPGPMKILGAQAPPEMPPERADGTGPPTKLPEQRILPQERERALKLLKEGDRHVTQGNIGAARIVYELAADAGLAEGAMALAATYDAVELTRLNVRGIQPNSTEARRWYERARQLGASDADQRLRRLGAN